MFTVRLKSLQLVDSWHAVPTFPYSNETQVSFLLHSSAHSCALFTVNEPSSFLPLHPPVSKRMYPAISRGGVGAGVGTGVGNRVGRRVG